MTVCTLIHLNDPELCRVQTLILETIRTGFPTAKIEVHQSFNVTGKLSITDQIDQVLPRCEDLKASYKQHTSVLHHADWIHRMLKEHNTEEPLVIVDPDVIFWDKFTPPDVEHGHLIAGRLIPSHRSEVGTEETPVIYNRRFDTSLLWFYNPSRLLTKLDCINPQPRNLNFTFSEYFPINFFRPVVVWDVGAAIFYDTCSNLYEAIDELACFQEPQLNQYDHVGHACSYKSVRDIVFNKDDLDHVFYLAKIDPSKLKGLWREQQAYYERRRSTRK